MNLFQALGRRALFNLDPETAHGVSIMALKNGLLPPCPAVSDPRLAVNLAGLEFPNPVGLAAGYDKNAEVADAILKLGFGFTEVGTITPRPQPGNPKPRLFRLRPESAIINRMGFNNKGIDHALTQIARSHYKGVLGINIGKNFDTPVECAAEDYLICMRKCYQAASYIVVNLSSPNTPGLRSLQFGEELRQLLALLKAEQVSLGEMHDKKVPLVVKIAPDLSDDEVRLIAAALLEYRIDGVIATNTTISREGLKTAESITQETGGVSGKPVRERSTEVIRYLHTKSNGSFPIIGVGGIHSADDAIEKLNAGASLVQVYTGFIYEGPALVKQINKQLLNAAK